jgi:hypothetical protein
MTQKNQQTITIHTSYNLKNSMDGETEMYELATLQVNWVYENHKHTKHDNT